MRIVHQMQRPIEIGLPVVEELLHLGKIGGQIGVLPDIGLQDEFEIGNAVENMCCCEAITIVLSLDIL